jgi:hypothetical protein
MATDRTGLALAKNSFDIKSELGIENQKFKSDLLTKVLKSPDKYYELRTKALERMLDSLIDLHFNLLVDFMYDGIYIVPSNPTAEHSKDTRLMIDDVPLRPRIPMNYISKKAVGMAEAISSIMMEVVNDVLPESHLDIAQKRDMKISEAETGVNFSGRR